MSAAQASRSVTPRGIRCARIARLSTDLIGARTALRTASGARATRGGGGAAARKTGSFAGDLAADSIDTGDGSLVAHPAEAVMVIATQAQRHACVDGSRGLMNREIGIGFEDH